MRLLGLLTALAIVTVSMVRGTTNAQTPFVKVRLEVDGREIVESKYKIVIDAGNRTIEPKLLPNGFVVPAEVRRWKRVKLHVILDNYDLVFSPLTRDHFDSEWLIRIDNPPFEGTPNPTNKKGKQLSLIYGIEFRPHNAEGTRWIIPVYK